MSIQDKSSFSVTVGTTDPVIIRPNGAFPGFPATATIVVAPGSTGSMTLKARVTEGAPFVDVDEATYTAATALVLNGPVIELEATATTAAGAVYVRMMR